MSKLTVEKLKHMKKGLKKVIGKIENNFAEDFEFNLSIHSKCVIGQLYENEFSPILSINYNRAMIELFGFCLSTDVEGFNENAPKLQKSLNSLFASNYFADELVSAKDWVKSAKKVLKSIKKEIKSIEVSN